MRIVVRGVKIVLLGLVLLCLVFAGFLILALDDAPSVGEMPPPTPEDVVKARAFVHTVRESVKQGAGAPIEVSEAQLNSVVRLGARLIPGYRGRLMVREDDVQGVASIPVPYAGGSKWLNIEAVVPAFDGAFTLSDVSVGGYALPPGATLTLGRVAANLVLGEQLGDVIIGAASGMEVDGDRLLFALNLGGVGSNGVMRGVFGSIRGSDLPTASEIERYYQLIRNAMDDGVLPREGSYFPYLTFALNAALEGSEREGQKNAFTSAMLALTRVCGAQNLTRIVSGIAHQDAGDDADWQVNCRDLTLNGRIDSRLHFTTAAAIQAASNRGFAVSVGEFKELYDSSRAGGFDFTDIAANNSGIRLANRFMEAPPETWPALIARLGSERDLIVAFDDIPQIMDDAQFEAKYGSVDSPRYLAQLDEIEARIDGLTLHRR